MAGGILLRWAISFAKRIGSINHLFQLVRKYRWTSRQPKPRPPIIRCGVAREIILVLPSRMHVYCLVSPSHKALYEEWFLRSLPPDCRPAPHFIQTSADAYAQGNWHQIVARKFELLELAFTNEPENSVFVMSDVDVRFYQSFAADISMRMRGYDVLFQHNRPTLPAIPEHLCTGFMGIRNNPRSRAFFRSAHLRLQECNRPEKGDQNACIDVLLQQPHSLRFGFLPVGYWSPGSEMGRWRPGMILSPPPNLILHHANHTVGIDHKVLQLQAVEEIRGEVAEKSPVPADGAL